MCQMMGVSFTLFLCAAPLRFLTRGCRCAVGIGEVRFRSAAV